MNTQGSARSQQSITGSLDVYEVWCASDQAFDDPEAATGINVRVTGNIADPSQKNFEILVQSIALRSNPVILEEPHAVADLSAAGAQVLTGQGFVWCFGTERAGVFADSVSDTALLESDLQGIVLTTGAVLATGAPGQNIEFRRKLKLC